MAFHKNIHVKYVFLGGKYKNVEKIAFQFLQWKQNCWEGVYTNNTRAPGDA